MVNNNIVELENKPININRLKAQRHLYSKVSKLTCLYFVLAVLFPIIISFIRYFPGLSSLDNISGYLIAYNLFALLMGWILDWCIRKKRGLAVNIQQLFDCEVLGLKWNCFRYKTKPSFEDVSHNLGKESDEKLLNWYDLDISCIQPNLAILICQRVNLVYDVNLRKKFLDTLTALAVVVVVAMLVVAFYRNEGFQTAVIFVGVPLIPIIKWFYETWRLNRSDIKTCLYWRGQIDSILENFKESGGEISNDLLEEVQFGIYEHRKIAFKIPDWIYNLMREKQEKEVNATINQIIAHYGLGNS